MKYLLLLVGACLGAASPALAQTVLPSGGVAPSGAVITPGSVPGAQTVTTPDMRDGGSPRAHRRDQKAPGMNHQDRKQLRKMSKVEPSSADKMKT